jgi:hypothetical protein
LPARFKERDELIEVGQLSARVASVVRGGFRLLIIKRNTPC